jgi:glycosyltransferase involved in cell wall biosynthesis
VTGGRADEGPRPGEGPAADGGALPVSVVVPTHDRAALLLATLESVLAQRPPAREVIVVDDGSTDDTPARLAPLAAAGRIRYVRQANAGLSAARNAGARLATSDYLLFLDDDDLLLPGALARLAAEAARHPTAGMICGGCLPFEREPAALEPAPPDQWRDADPAAFLLWNRVYTAGQVLIRRDVFRRAGEFDASVSPVEDWDMWLRLLAAAGGRWSSSPTLAYRYHPGGISRNVARMYRRSLRVARRHIARLPAERRPAFRLLSYERLRHEHAAGIARVARAAAAEGRWRRVAEAVRAWSLAWAAEAGARIALKAHLLRRGRWRLPRDDEALRADERHA